MKRFLIVFLVFTSIPVNADPSDEAFFAVLAGVGLFGATKYSYEAEENDVRHILTLRIPYQKVIYTHIPKTYVVTPTYHYQTGSEVSRHEISTGLRTPWSAGRKFSDVPAARVNWLFLNYAFVIDNNLGKKLQKFSPGFSVNLWWFPLNFSYDYTKLENGSRRGYSIWLDFVLR